MVHVNTHRATTHGMQTFTAMFIHIVLMHCVWWVGRFMTSSRLVGPTVHCHYSHAAYCMLMLFSTVSQKEETKPM